MLKWNDYLYCFFSYFYSHNIADKMRKKYLDKLQKKLRRAEIKVADEGKIVMCIGLHTSHGNY